MTAREAREFLGIKRATFYELVGKGKLKVTRSDGFHMSFRKADVIKFKETYKPRKQAEYRYGPGFIYFLRAEKTEKVVDTGWDDLFKVGVTKHNTYRRFKSIQINCPFELYFFGVIKHKHAREAEKEILEKLKSGHIRGEWYIAHEKKIRALILEYGGHITNDLNEVLSREDKVRIAKESAEIIDNMRYVCEMEGKKVKNF